MWLWSHPDWPNFTWDAESLASSLADTRHRQGRLLGRMEGLGFDLRQEASLSAITSDVVKSSAIEGEMLDAGEVRSSIARRLGMDIAGLPRPSREVDAVVEMMLDATQGFSRPLTAERLIDWQAALFPTGRSGLRLIATGGWRTSAAGPMRVVSGPFGREKVHFEAPPAERLESEMAAFLEWFESGSDADPVLRAGISHLWFLTIHPFEDGNGRIARAIADMALARADGQPDRCYSLSAQIESERKDYYKQLEQQQRGDADITPWLQWFLGCLGRAAASAEQSLSRVLFKAQLWNAINRNPGGRAPVNRRQQQIINRMLEDGFVGYMNTSKYAKLAKCSTDTALRDIQDLKARGVFLPNPAKGRSTSYRLPEDAASLP